MNNFEFGIRQAWANVAVFVPHLLAFLLILCIGYFVAKLLHNLTTKALLRLKFNDLVERGGLKRALHHSGYEVSDVLAKLVYFGVMLFTLQLAFGVFGSNPVSDLLTRMIAFLPNIFVAIFILVISAWIANTVKDVVGGSLGRLSYGKFVADFAAVAILVVGVFAALNQLNIAPAILNGLFYASLAIVAGSAIIAIGGGGIVPMRQMWERALAKATEEAPRIQQAASQQGGLPSERGAQQYPPDLDHRARDRELTVLG